MTTLESENCSGGQDTGKQDTWKQVKNKKGSKKWRCAVSYHSLMVNRSTAIGEDSS